MKKDFVIFLDIDGVMRCDWERNLDLFSEHCSKELGILFNLIPELKIVITSNWRHDMKDVEYAFDMAGLDYSRVIGKTEYFKNRGEEIKDYIETFHIKDYLILDDEIVNLECFKEEGTLLVTDKDLGLTKPIGITILNRFKK